MAVLMVGDVHAYYGDLYVPQGSSHWRKARRWRGRVRCSPQGFCMERGGGGGFGADVAPAGIQTQ